MDGEGAYFWRFLRSSPEHSSPPETVWVGTPSASSSVWLSPALHAQLPAALCACLDEPVPFVCCFAVVGFSFFIPKIHPPNLICMRAFVGKQPLSPGVFLSLLSDFHRKLCLLGVTSWHSGIAYSLTAQKNDQLLAVRCYHIS